MTLREVLEKYFKGKRHLDFHPSDRLGDCYIRYHLDGGVMIEMGSSGGETEIFFTREPEKLDAFLNLLIYG